jgi:hypothetical protein
MTGLTNATVLVTPRSFGLHDPSMRAELEAAFGVVRYNTAGRPLRARGTTSCQRYEDTPHPGATGHEDGC